MDKLYNFKDEESKTKDIFKKAFKKNPNKNSEKKYTIIMPPPNVTGKLHIGHALTFTIQDMLIRHNRMKGLDAKWQAGIDHAGIATQMVTEREMLKQGIKKDDLSKQQFIEKIWEQKEKSQKEIFSQFEMLGLCCDFDNAVFTMDDIPKTAVKKAFVELYNDGLIYKSKDYQF